MLLDPSCLLHCPCCTLALQLQVSSTERAASDQAQRDLTPAYRPIFGGAGEYIAVENIETVYKKLGLVEQIWVYGNSYESTLVAVVVPEAGGLQAWARQAGVSGDHAALCSNPQTKSHLLAELNKTGKASKLKVEHDLASGFMPRHAACCRGWAQGLDAVSPQDLVDHVVRDISMLEDFLGWALSGMLTECACSCAGL